MKAVIDDQVVIPSFGRLLREAGALVHFARRFRSAAGRAPGCANGRAVMVIPGFLASDLSTTHLRGALAEAGYAAHGWDMGANLGARADTLERLAARLDAVAADGAPVSLVGWSLGGLYARELAKLRPEQIDRVVTLGSPFSGNPRGNHAWRLYELVSGHKVDRPPIAVRTAEKPPVPTWAFWSAEDGVVAPACARGQAHERDFAVELACRHLGFVSDPVAIAAILKALAA
ncbi:alpha/beta hydrolase [Sphingomonas sp. 1P06PA]|uniref:esterase/lipase family protein n=1 Tax=Sphingomonas sp. 1P06PA TaxID=554121 RepID=UPI0039A549C8